MNFQIWDLIMLIVVIVCVTGAIIYGRIGESKMKTILLVTMFAIFAVVVFLFLVRSSSVSVQKHVHKTSEELEFPVSDNPFRVGLFKEGKDQYARDVAIINLVTGAAELPTKSEPIASPESWQAFADQVFSIGFPLEQISDQLFAVIRDSNLDPTTATARGEGSLAYQFKDLNAALVIREESTSIEYNFEPQTPLTIEGIERTGIVVSFHRGEGFHGFIVEARSRSVDPNLWRGVLYSFPETAVPLCMKLYPAGSERPMEWHPIIGVNRLSEERLAAWEKKIEDLVRQVKPEKQEEK